MPLFSWAGISITGRDILLFEDYYESSLPYVLFRSIKLCSIAIRSHSLLIEFLNIIFYDDFTFFYCFYFSCHIVFTCKYYLNLTIGIINQKIHYLFWTSLTRNFAKV